MPSPGTVHTSSNTDNHRPSFVYVVLSRLCANDKFSFIQEKSGVERCVYRGYKFFYFFLGGGARGFWKYLVAIR